MPPAATSRRRPFGAVWSYELKQQLDRTDATLKARFGRSAAVNTALHPLRIILLALAASALGIAILSMDGMRGAGRATAAPSPVTSPGLVQPTAATSPAAPGALVSSAARSESPTTTAVPRRGGVACGTHTVVRVPRELIVRSSPDGRRIGAVPATSVYMGQVMTVWVQEITQDGRWGRITVPWSKPVTRTGWIELAGLPRGTTRTMVVGDLSERSVTVYRGCAAVYSTTAAIGAPGSPSPQGKFWVTDRVAVPRSQPYFGSYAFGLSTIQPNPPPGWRGGNQMAIHGTNSPRTIGSAASAGCLRVDEPSLDRLKPLLRPGTPVIITA